MLPRGIETISHRDKLSLSREEKEKTKSFPATRVPGLSITAVFWVAFNFLKGKILGFAEELKIGKGDLDSRTAWFHVKGK